MPHPCSAGRRARTLVAGIAVGAALAVGLTSCGSAGMPTAGPAASSTPLVGLAPAQAVRTAFENLGHATTVHTQVRLARSPGASTGMTAGLTPAQQALLRDGTLDVTMTAPQGEDLGQAMGDASPGKSRASVDVSLNDGQGPLLAIRSVGGSLYGMANLPQLSRVAGKDLGRAATSLGAQDPALAPIMADIAAGKWLEISAGALASYQSLLGQGAGASGLGAGIAGDVKAALTKDVAWTAAAKSGTYDGSLQARSFVADLYPDLARLSQLGGSPLPPKEALLARIPAGTTISAEVATADDQVTSVSVNLLQLNRGRPDLKVLGPHPRVDLVASFDTTAAPVTAPPDAVLLDKQIPALLMGLGGLSAGTSS